MMNVRMFKLPIILFHYLFSTKATRPFCLKIKSSEVIALRRGPSIFSLLETLKYVIRCLKPGVHLSKIGHNDIIIAKKNCFKNLRNITIIE